jgi:hypothetical protein
LNNRLGEKKKKGERERERVREREEMMDIIVKNQYENLEINFVTVVDPT